MASRTGESGEALGGFVWGVNNTLYEGASKVSLRFQR